MQVFSEISFTQGIDWAKYLLALAQLVSDAFIALVFCDYEVRLSPLAKSSQAVQHYDTLYDTLKIISLSLNAFDGMISFLGGYYFLTSFNVTSLIVGSALLALKFISDM